METGQITPLIYNRYRIIKGIGQGGMGEVYLAHDSETNQSVAVKWLKANFLTDAAVQLERFRREGEALHQLNHPNIVKMLAAIEEQEQHYLVMEYVAGGSLAELLKQQHHLSVEQVLKIGLEVADALARTHHLNIIHRDLKPANILLAEDGTPRLTDFGVAHIHASEEVTQEGLIIGTLNYLSPEAVAGKEATTGSDIWAFGVLLFEMLTGERPFKGESVFQQIVAINRQPVPDLEQLCPDVPVALVDLIYRMLDKDPQQRIKSARLVGAELESIQRGTTTLASQSFIRIPQTNDLGAQVQITPQPLFHNLPIQATTFVGREEERLELARLLQNDDVRLITILGPGGMGKTRLALEAAREHLPAFTNGVFLVSLAPLTTTDSIIPTIAEAVKFSFQGAAEPKHQLLDFLRAKQMLLIFDNCEHLLPVAVLVDEILQAAPAVKIIATSRSKLNLQAETVFRLEGMDFPEWETPEDALAYSAVKLFLQSARRAQPGFTLKADDLMYIARICQQVQGMPLGILLAAAWVDMLSLEEISAEIARNLDFLETEQQNIPARQRSIRAVFDYSWMLLSDDERLAFAKLSVFRSGSTREAAQSITGASLRTMTALVNKSMVRRDANSGRYEVHELLREYAAEKLIEFDLTNTIQEAHATYFADYMDERWLDLKGRRQIAAVSEMEIEFNNLRAAWLHLASHQPGRLLNFASGLWFFCYIRGRYPEAIDLFNQALTAVRSAGTENQHAVVIGHLLALQGWNYVDLGMPEKGKTLVQDGITLLEKSQDQDAEALVMALASLCRCYGFLGTIAEGQVTAEQALEIAQRSGNQWATVLSLYHVASVQFAQRELNNARQLGELCINLAEEVGDVWLMASVSAFVIGWSSHNLEEYDKAKKYMYQGLRYFEEFGPSGSVSECLATLGDLNWRTANFADSRHYFQQSLRMRKERGEPTWVVIVALLKFAELFIAENRKAEAAAVLSLITHHPDTAKSLFQWVDGYRDQLQAELPANIFQAAWEHGKQLDLETLVEALIANKKYYPPVETGG